MEQQSHLLVADYLVKFSTPFYLQVLKFVVLIMLKDMGMQFTDLEIEELVLEMCALSAETEWLEFKVNFSEPEKIADYISGLANAATLHGKHHGYLIWGVDDTSHEIVGSDFNYLKAKKGNQELELYLNQVVSGNSNFYFSQARISGKNITVLTIESATGRPVKSSGRTHCRIGTSLVNVGSYPELEKQLWDAINRELWETGFALDSLMSEEVISLLSVDTYFNKSGNTRPESHLETLKYLETQRVVGRRDDGRWRITNLGALLLAKDLNNFPSLARKAVRVIHYSGEDRIETLKRQDGQTGYAVGFSGLLSWVESRIPSSEIILEGTRLETAWFSSILLREAIANALIHQDFSIRGSSPLIEIFSDRIEISNPGAPLLQADRMINYPPRSRNENLAGLMRQMGLCEEAGSGWDKIAAETEVRGLPSPKIEVEDDATRVILFGPRDLMSLEKEDKIRAVYFHACLQWAKRKPTTNSTIRDRFGISPRNSATVSRLIADAISAGQIAIYDETVGNKAKSYVPYWEKLT